jgi:6-phosphogluconate dehydrogenase (decarboxylating)
MKLAMIGLGRMGGSMTERLLGEGHEVVANSRFIDSVRRAGELAADGIGFLDAGTSDGVWGLKEAIV